jgi:hypothetical protein
MNLHFFFFLKQPESNLDHSWGLSLFFFSLFEFLFPSFPSWCWVPCRVFPTPTKSTHPSWGSRSVAVAAEIWVCAFFVVSLFSFFLRFYPSINWHMNKGAANAALFSFTEKRGKKESVFTFSSYVCPRCFLRLMLPRISCVRLLSFIFSPLTVSVLPDVCRFRRKTP